MPATACTTHRLDQLAVVQQLTFVLNVIASEPGLDLVSEPLEFLDLALELELKFLLLCLGCWVSENGASGGP